MHSSDIKNISMRSIGQNTTDVTLKNHSIGNKENVKKIWNEKIKEQTSLQNISIRILISAILKTKTIKTTEISPDSIIPTSITLKKIADAITVS